LEKAIAQVYGGMRDVKACQRYFIRGFSGEYAFGLRSGFKLPKPNNAEMPYVGGLYYLFLVGSLPTLEQALLVEDEWKKRGEVPQYVFDAIRSVPSDAHPMTLLTLAVLTLQRESLFSKLYHEGLKKEQYWEPMLEDSLNLTAKLPEIAAFIYRLKYKNDDIIPSDPKLDWAGNFAHMMGIKDLRYEDLARLYFLLHSDHEVGTSVLILPTGCIITLGYLLCCFSWIKWSGWSIARFSKPGVFVLVAGC
jgi:citrate synthase